MLRHKDNRSSQSKLRFKTSGDMNAKVCQQIDNLTMQCIRRYATIKKNYEVGYIKD